MARYAQIAEAIHTRIRHGDYRVREFPSLAELAEELGANSRTIVKAMNQLMESGVLRKLSTGRITVNTETDTATMHLVMLAPAYPSLHVMLWHRTVERLAAARGWRVKLVSYSHWQDPTIAKSLSGFDACLLLPGGETPTFPADIIHKIKACGKPVVTVDIDTSEHGIPCLQFAATHAIPSLLDSLLAGQHETIACFNSQPNDETIRQRIAQWNFWVRMHGLTGQLLDFSVPPFSSAIDQAYARMSETLKKSELKATAIFCTTGAAALGVMRALSDHGIEPGKDIAVCAADDEAGRAQYFRPSLTCVKDPQWDPYVDVVLDWFASEGKPWVGPLKVHPSTMPIFVGESTASFKR